MLVTCLNCSKEFDKKSSEIKKSPNHYCSRKCSATCNNRKSPKRKLEGKCSECGVAVTSQRKYCRDCLLERKKIVPKCDYTPEHHTKDKGDIGVLAVSFDLSKHGIRVANPASEHLPFDLIAISPDLTRLARVSVKYAAAEGPVVRGSLKNSWADKNGNHASYPNYDHLDVCAIYCPDTNECYYVGKEDFGKGNFTLRLEKPELVSAMSRMAEDYKNPFVMF